MVNTSEQVSQTLAGFEIPYFIIGISLSEHLLHSKRPQCLQWCFRVVMPNFCLHSSNTIFMYLAACFELGAGMW